MRKTTLLWLCLAVVCGALLFKNSQQVTDGRARLASLEQKIRKEDESIRVLQAEWSYLNQPERLEKLTRQYLDLAPMQGRQFVKAQDLPVRMAPEEAVSAVSREEGQEPKIAAKPVEKPVAKPVPKVETVKAETVKLRTPPVPPAHAPAPAVAKKETAPPKTGTASAAPIIQRPHAPPPSATTPAAAQKRDFGDLMQSLGVN